MMRVVATTIAAVVVASACGPSNSAAPPTDSAASVDRPATSLAPVFDPSPTVAIDPVPTSVVVPATTTTTVAPTTTTSTTTTVPEQPAHSPEVCATTSAPIWDVRPRASLPVPPVPSDWTIETFGTSVLGRPLTALHRPSGTPTRTVLVVGGVHGNEPVSPPTVRGFVAAAIPDDVDVWLVPELNADGIAAGTRCNANGVDLNRNFDWNWRTDTGGPGPLSEPEPAAIAALVERLAPDVVVWVHQPYGYVSSIGPTSDTYEQAWADGSGVPVRPDVTQHGGGESWTAFVAQRPSMLIEIDSWDATEEITVAHRAGFEALLAVVVPA